MLPWPICKNTIANFKPCKEGQAWGEGSRAATKTCTSTNGTTLLWHEALCWLRQQGVSYPQRNRTAHACRGQMVLMRWNLPTGLLSVHRSGWILISSSSFRSPHLTEDGLHRFPRPLHDSFDVQSYVGASVKGTSSFDLQESEICKDNGFTSMTVDVTVNVSLS